MFWKKWIKDNFVTEYYFKAHQKECDDRYWRHYHKIEDVGKRVDSMTSDLQGHLHCEWPCGAILRVVGYNGVGQNYVSYYRCSECGKDWIRSRSALGQPLILKKVIK